MHTFVFLLGVDMGKDRVLCCFINVDKGQICNNPACAETAFYGKDGSATYIPVCSARGHIHSAYRFRLQLEKGLKPEDIENLNPKRLRYRNPKTQKIKMKFQPPEPKKATAGWKWTDEFDKWRNVHGKIVPIKTLHDDELIDAMQAIRRANWSRITTKIAWITPLL